MPGEFAAHEARKALAAGLNALVFSSGVPFEKKRALKVTAREKGLLLMGPDCGTALIAGTPVAFANAVPRGDIGIVSASGTGLQEVSCLIARLGGGVSHGIGVGGRDLDERVGALGTLAAIDALEADAATRTIVLISKPPAPAVADEVLAPPFALREAQRRLLLGFDRPDWRPRCARRPRWRPADGPAQSHRRIRPKAAWWASIAGARCAAKPKSSSAGWA